MTLTCEIATTPEERYEIYRFRYSIYIEELHKSLAFADHRQKLLRDEIDDHATIFYVRDGARIVGTVRSLNAGDYLPASYNQWFDIDRLKAIPRRDFNFTSRMMIEASYRGTAVAHIMIGRGYEAGRLEGCWLNLIHCAPCLVALYEKLGYRRIGTRIVNTDVGQHLTMALVGDDLTYLGAIRSSLLPLASRYPGDSGHGQWFKDTFPEHQQPASAKLFGLVNFTSQLAHRLVSETGPLLDGISVDEIGATLKQAAVLRVHPGDFVVRKGELGSEFFLILEGVAEAQSPVNGARVVLRTMGKGDVFGELAVLGSGRRSADVVALTHLELLVLTADFLERITTQHPAIASKLFLNLSKVLAERLASHDDLLICDGNAMDVSEASQAVMQNMESGVS